MPVSEAEMLPPHVNDTYTSHRSVEMEAVEVDAVLLEYDGADVLLVLEHLDC